MRLANNFILILCNYLYPTLSIIIEQPQFFSGGYSCKETPLPISNREVKLTYADGTTCAGVWESR